MLKTTGLKKQLASMLSVSVEELPSGEEAAFAVADQAAEEVAQAPSITDVVETVSENSAVASAIDMVTQHAEAGAEAPVEQDAAVALESSAFAMAVLMKAHGVDYVQPSVESASDVKGALTELANGSRERAIAVRNHTRSSLEAQFDSIDDSIGEINKAIFKSEHAIGTTINKIKTNAAKLETSGVQINHRGIYNFLHYMGDPVTSLGGIVKRDLDNLGKLIKVAGQFSSFYQTLEQSSKNLHGSDQNSIRKFLSVLGSFDPAMTLRQLEGIHFLFNGETYLDFISSGELGDEVYYPIMQMAYPTPSGDGSMAPKEEREKAKHDGRRDGSILGGLFGAIIGAFVGNGLPGKVIGAVIGGAAGGVVFGWIGGSGSEKHTNWNYRGSNTESSSSMKEVLEFLNDSQTFSKLVNPMYQAADKASSNNEFVLRQIEKQLDLISGTELGIRLATEFVKIWVGADTNSNMLEGRNGDVKTLVRDRMDMLYSAHLSLVEVIAKHAYICTSAAAAVARQLSGAVDQVNGQ